MRVVVCVLLCTRRMVTVIAARRCMRVLVCVLLCTRRMVAVIAAMQRIHVTVVNFTFHVDMSAIVVTCVCTHERGSCDVCTRVSVIMLMRVFIIHGREHAYTEGP